MFCSEKNKRLKLAAAGLCLAAVFFASCTKQPADPGAPAASTAVSLSARGRSVYMANCIACHNADPSKNGPIGPAVQGASLALLTKRVMEASYPEGYQPKRSTKAMAALPHLQADLPALEAFLGQN